MDLLTALVVSVFFSVCAFAQDCVWDKDTEFPAYPPLLIEDAAWLSYKPTLENGTRVVRIKEGTSVVVACPGENLITGGEVAEAICQGGSLVINRKSYHISELACDNRVDDDAIILEGQNCVNGSGTLNGIGFKVEGKNFYQIIDVCFDNESKLSKYTKHVIYGKSVSASDVNPSRPSFKMDSGFYDDNPDNCYLTVNQAEYFGNLSGDPEYIDLDSGKYFSRGHLSPNAGFFVEMEADATFYYINAFPQWQEYNAKNWAYAEKAVRNIAADHESNLDVWTGPYGQLILAETPIYHCASQNSNIIPTPELVWKVIYEPSSNTGISIVMSNKPYYEQPSIICPDLSCETIPWIFEELWSPDDLTKGYTYCCTVQDLKAAVPEAPELPKDTGILL